jgi:hypothetical protein
MTEPLNVSVTLVPAGTAVCKGGGTRCQVVAGTRQLTCCCNCIMCHRLWLFSVPPGWPGLGSGLQLPICVGGGGGRGGGG